jgi:uncharacterized protein (TIGR02996 family)
MARRRPSTAPSPRPEELAFLQGIVDNPGDDGRFLILADWLEDHDDSRRAELLRLHRRLLATCCEPDAHPERAAWQSRVAELLRDGVWPSVPRRTVALDEGEEMVFAWVPPGTFLMGSPPEERERGDDETLHRVTLTQGFWMSVTPVTQVQWEVVTGYTPSPDRGDDRPVVMVPWDDCKRYCRGLKAWAGTRGRLPTEAEWEYACRAGTTTSFHFGELASTSQAPYNGIYTYAGGKKRSRREKTTPVGSYPPNAWGLFDMHGNVWEWCQDRYGRNPSAEVEDPQGPNSGAARVVRGGSWADSRRWCRAASRGGSTTLPGSFNIGCRVVLPPD